ncbi:chorismate mutase [Fusobacterium massiliense]|jgi:chorismate mutase|uniref:chorismate mutase n=1 Tax=Fusobacterium massiliense TaxID=1852365 RepID=UPI0028D77F8D|nr:chorismate mutase [Fusobacterium massiliense]
MIKLNLLRKKIDDIDDELIALFLKRLDISKEIGELKKENNMKIYDPEREEEIIGMSLKNIDDNQKKYVEKFLRTLMDISKEVQKSD